jgi:hypothetical protein
MQCCASTFHADTRYIDDAKTTPSLSPPFLAMQAATAALTFVIPDGGLVTPTGTILRKSVVRELLPHVVKRVRIVPKLEIIPEM